MGVLDWIGDDPDYKIFEREYKEGRLGLMGDRYWGPLGLNWFDLPLSSWTFKPGSTEAPA